LNRFFQAACILLALTAGLAVGAVGFASYLAIFQLADAAKKAGTAADAMTATMANINRPCTPIKGQILTVDNAKNCGLLAHSAITLDTLRGTLGQVEAAAKKNSAVSTDLHNTQIALQGMVGSLVNTSDALAGTANAATGTLHAATETLGEGKRTIAAAQPLLGQVTGAVQDMRSVTPDVKRIAKATGDTMEQAAGIGTSVNKMAATAEKKVDAKPTIKSRVVDYAGPAAKIIAWLLK
jgi:hypothetical protein